MVVPEVFTAVHLSKLSERQGNGHPFECVLYFFGSSWKNPGNLSPFIKFYF